MKYWRHTFGMLIILIVSNIPLKAQRQNILTSTERADGWQLLFDGKTTHGWHSFNYNRVLSPWKVRNGKLIFRMDKDGQRGWDIVTDEEFEDFDLRLEWKISKGGNSGIFYGVKEGKEYGWASSTGVEMQILDNKSGDDRHDPKHLAGAMYDLIDASQTSKPKHAGKWNKCRILKQDGYVTFYLNDIVTAYVYTKDEKWEELLRKSKWHSADKYNGADFAKFDRGKIALQDHFDKVSFRNIKLCKLNLINN